MPVDLANRRMSPATLSTYGTSVALLDRFLGTTGMRRSPAAVNREHIEAFNYRPARLLGTGHGAQPLPRVTTSDRRFGAPADPTTHRENLSRPPGFVGTNVLTEVPRRARR